MMFYALVPVRVKLHANSAAEVARATTLVKTMVNNWQDACREDFDDNGPEKGSTAAAPEDQPSWVDHRQPCDPVDVYEL